MGDAILLTRPREDSERLAALLAQEGMECLIDPMLEIVPLPGAPEEIAERIRNNLPPPAGEGAQALIVTSRHALPALASISAARALPLYAVGAHTAETAGQHGFNVPYAAENGEALLAHIATAMSPGRGPLLYVSGKHVSADIATILAGKGFYVERIAAYEARAATALSPQTVNALNAGNIAAALFFSRRTLEIFERLAEAAGCAPHLASVTACCLSKNVASCARLPWKRVPFTSSADEAGMMRLLRERLPARQE